MGQCPALNTWKVLYKIHYLLFTTESIAQDNRMSHALGQSPVQTETSVKIK